MNALWLISRSGIGSFLFPIETISVEPPSRNAFDHSVKIAVSDILHDNRTLPRPHNAHLDFSSARRPHEKAACVLAYKNAAKSFMTCSHVSCPCVCNFFANALRRTCYQPQSGSSVLKKEGELT